VGSPATTLRFGGLARIVYGLLALFAPKRMFAAFGFDGPDPDVRYFNALFGGRDILVGLWILKALRDGDEDLALKANIACEATDSIALANELRERGGFDQTTTAALAFNVVGWLSWLGVLVRRR
jgi:hypothetical protein